MVHHLPNEGDTTSGDVMRWVWSQGIHMSRPSHQVLLAYLASNAFLSDDNDEGEEVGIVMYRKSYFEEIMAGTGVRSRATLRAALDDLQEMAYIRREERYRPTDPLRITVFWHESDDEFRERLRAGRVSLPPALQRAKKEGKSHAKVVPLEVVKDAT